MSKFFVVNRSTPGYLAEREADVVFGLEAARAAACSLVGEELEALSEACALTGEEQAREEREAEALREGLRRLESAASEVGEEGASLFGADGSALGFVITVQPASASEAFEAASGQDREYAVDLLGEWLDEAFFGGKGCYEEAASALGDIALTDQERGRLLGAGQQREQNAEAQAREVGLRSAALSVRLGAFAQALGVQAQGEREAGREGFAQRLLDHRASALDFASHARGVGDELARWREEAEALKATREVLAAEGGRLAAELAAERAKSAGLEERLQRVTEACERAAAALRATR